MTALQAGFNPEFLSSIFGFTTLVASTLAGITWGTVKNLREAAGDLRARVKDLEDSRADDRQKLAELGSENKTLRGMVTGEVHWTAITELLQTHHEDAVGVWGEILPLLRFLAESNGYKPEQRGPRR